MSAVSAPGGFQSAFGYEGPLLTSIATSGPVAGTIGFSYDADLRLAGRTVAGGAAVDFAYDADGLLTRAGALTLARDAPSGLLAATSLGTTADSRTRTGFAELDVYIAQVSGAPAYAYDLDRDAAGRIVRKTETIGGVTTEWEYGYHAERGWLTEVRKDGVPVASYGYDGNGNRTSWSDFWGSGTATYDAQDRQLTAGGASFTYTKNGERLTKIANPESTTYSYDIRGALVEVELPDGIAITYLVDAEGRRIGKRVNGVLTQGWLYAGGLSPVAETDGTGAITATFVYATKGNVPDYLVKEGTAYRLFTDHLGSVRLVVDTTNSAIAQRLDYDAWGRITCDSQPGWQPFGFAGGIYDHQTGLVRFGARDYDPETGRWTAKDPIGFAGGSAGLYTYVEDDPVNATDLSGLQSDRYHGMMREWVENPALMRGHTRGARNAVAAFGVMAFTYPVVEYLYTAASYCLLRPEFCAEIGVSAAEVVAGVDGPSVSAAAPAKRVFWSGGALAEAAATSFAEAIGGATLGMTTLGRATTAATQGLDWLTEARPVWAAAPREFARGASGEVHVFRSTTRSFNSIWLTDELPELIENPSVTRFVFHDVLPDGTIVTP